METPFGIKIIAVLFRVVLGLLVVGLIYVLFTQMDDGFSGLFVPTLFFYLGIFWYGFYVLTNKLVDGNNFGRWGLVVYSLVGVYATGVNVFDGLYYREKSLFSFVTILFLCFFVWCVVYLLFAPSARNFFAPKQMSVNQIDFLFRQNKKDF